MLIIFLIIATSVVLFALGAILGAPYLPTRNAQATTALELLDLKAGQTVLDLGSGDGSFLLAAAKQGLRGIGYEINPLLFIWSKLRTRKYRGSIKIKLANYWRQTLPVADGIYVFLINHYMKKLNRKLEKEITRPTKVVSYTFLIPGKQSEQKINGLYLYLYGDS